ncbi:DUF1801 domain-containing protein [Oceanicola sp. 502str15]|uniref:DUF1801 domain-containing protein n=1 Tax=Oceanicola sp. 502str15 TaxID=2696061 RepID=UPI002094DB31|nr:DUF1801 domain-containing protein [Oceanicola sp. 502str15]MCO6383401.1 DUF1801 domain-containing protein [Oceanicola sp. 502str15]
MTAPNPPFASTALSEAFTAFPAPLRKALLSLRALIYEVAEATPGVGALEESLKWGQPSYATAETGAGSPVRLGCPKAGGFAIYVPCSTRIIPDFQALFPEGFRFDGTRGVLFDQGETVDEEALRLLIAGAQTYHLRKKARA